MMFGLFRRRRVPPSDPPSDPQALIERLSGVRLGEGYDERDRHADFAAVFSADERGRQVLSQILAWGHLWRPSYRRGDPHETAFRDGERNLALRILAVLSVEPNPGPEARNNSTRPHPNEQRT